MLPSLQPFSLDRMIRAMLRADGSLRRSADALRAAAVPFAVSGPHAVAAWIERVDPDAVRIADRVELLIDATMLDRACDALIVAGFSNRRIDQTEVFFDNPRQHPVKAVRVNVSGSPVTRRPGVRQPTLADAASDMALPYIRLEPLVRFFLALDTAESGMDLRDLIGVGLIDNMWPDAFASVLAERLRAILADPNG